MGRYLLLRTPDAALIADTPLVRAKDAGLIGEMAELLAYLRSDRASVPVAREAARQEGYAEGVAAGREAGEREAREEAARTLASVVGALRDHRRAVADEAADLAVAITRRVLPELAGADTLAGLVRTAAAELQAETPRAVRVRPEDAGALAEALGGAGLTVEPDARLGEGQLILETEAGSAEIGLSARIDVLAEALRG